MKVTVMNRINAVRYSYGCHPSERSAIVSINDIEEKTAKFRMMPDNNIKGVCSLHFDDVESGSNAISEKDAEKIAEFVKRYMQKIDLLIVHCSAGVSRSAGCAAAILKAITGSDSQIFDNPQYKPNMKVYRTVLNAMMKDENG